MPFQTAVGIMPAPAVEGDFCDTNPRYTYDAGPGGVVSGALSGVAGISGLLVGRFAWVTSPLDADNAAAVANNSGSGPVSGFVHREQQGLFTVYLQEVTMAMPPGFPATLFSGGGFWVVNRGTAEATVGMKAYANYNGGAVSFAATGSPTTAATGSASSIAAETSSFTGSIVDNLMTVTGAVTGTIYPGTTISGTNVASGTLIISQASGMVGGDGTYYVSIPDQSVAATTISGTYGLLTVGGTVTGTFAIGGNLTGTSVVAGTAITALGTGTGGAGTYAVNNNTVVSSTSIGQIGNVETKWIAMSAAPAGGLVKISNQPLG